ncbi:MAG: hypothetical protein JSV37_12770 [Anaerolineaceae bacterium]|nr:MAG: hypothetical protein JSV37_12770 [Anaerolineaceae bacterium]
MSTLQKIVNGFSIWLWWLITCIAGLFIGLTASFFVYALTNPMLADPSQRMYFYIAFPLAGLTLGFSQWLLIRRYLPQVRRWILANTLSYTLSLILWIFLDTFFQSMVDNLGYINIVAVGIASLLLWLIIRRRFLRSLGWALASFIGLFTFFYTIRIVGYDLGQSSGLYIIGDHITFAFSTGLPSGIASGILVVLLLGPVLTRDSTLVEGLARLSEVSKFSTRPDLRESEAPSSEPSFAKLLLVKIGLPLLTIGVLVLILWITGSSSP